MARRWMRLPKAVMTWRPTINRSPSEDVDAFLNEILQALLGVEHSRPHGLDLAAINSP